MTLHLVARLAISTAALACCCLAGEPRTIVTLDTGWRFQRGDWKGASAPGFVDAAWQAVSVPHTFNDDSDPPQAGYYRGPGWYRRAVSAPASWKGRRVFVRFEAASLTGLVYFNGHELGEHKGGFQAFCFELTQYLKLGANNLLAVRVDNAKREDMIPLGGDFTVFGGLYRPVSLIVTGPVAITPLDAGSPGAFLKTRDVTTAQATVDLVTEVSNGGPGARAVELQVTVFDAQGNKVMNGRAKSEVGAGRTQPVPQSLSIKNPHLWNGVADPYLYTARIEILDGKRVLDSLDQPLGLRSFSLDPARGAVLNGQPMQIRGVNRHQDWAGLGWAIGQKEQDTDMAIMREMGVNGVRLAHYQHSEYFYSLCDRYGLLVWAELPMINGVHGTPEFLDSTRQQLIELIRQNQRHPSIVMWSLFNELSTKNKDNPVPIVESLKALAKAEDPGRVTTGAFSITGIEQLPDVARISELLALNVYPGWAVENFASMGSIIDRWNSFYGSHGLIISEYGAGASIHQHQQDFSRRSEIRAPLDWHPEEWQALVHEGNYADIRTRAYVPGSFIWNMFDFASAGRKEGDALGINDKGLVTRDRKVRKDAYYFYQANWTNAPMVYITSRRDTERSESLTQVKVYSNLPRVNLKVNGKVIGDSSGDDQHVFLWKNVGLAAGENKIEAIASGPAGARTDSCVWSYQPK